MTWEEANEILEDWNLCHYTPSREAAEAVISALDPLEIISALRLVSREQVKKKMDAAVDCIYKIEDDLDRLRELAQADREGRCVVLPLDDYTWTIRGDIVRGIIKANCRAAKKEAEAALRREQDG